MKGDSKLRCVGQSVPRLDARVKVTGQAQFGADINLPGMLWGKMLRSPYPHARILNIDTSKAKKLPGVRAVVTIDDTPKIPYGVQRYNHDKYPFAHKKVRFVGEDIAAVAAIDADIAEEALSLIDVEYEPLPAVLDPVKAMEEGTPLVHDNVKNNISAETHMNFGDVERAFQTADYVREDFFSTQAIIHGFIEPHAVVGKWDAAGKVTIWAPKQSPYITYRHMARALDIPLHNLRVVQTFVGGGFGGKHDPFGLDFAAVLLSRKANGLPVKIVLEQEEVFLSGIRRHPMQIKLKTGVTKEGKLLGSQCEIIADGGAYTGIGAVTIYLSGIFLTLPYALPNARYDGYRVYTNKPWSGALRGHGIPQIRFACESQLDMIAEDLNIDPIDIRLRNAVKSGHETGNGLIIRSCGLTESINKAEKLADFKRKRASKEHQTTQKGKKRGIGIACNAMLTGGRQQGHNSSTAIVKMHEDGRVSLLTGSTDVGQGSSTVLAQILAEKLGLDVEEVIVPNVDTEMTPIDPGTFGSRVTYTSGNAVIRAANEVKKRLLEAAAPNFECRPEELELGDHCVYLIEDSGQKIPLIKAVRIAYYDLGQPVVGVGFYKPEVEVPNIKTGIGNRSMEYSFGTQVAEVEVDIQTGEVTLLKMYFSHDSGVPVNPMLIEGQLEGATVSGLGQVYHEDLPLKEGLAFPTNFADYGMPTALDAPRTFSFDHVVTGSFEEGTFKEAGEGTQISTLPAIANAIYDAVGVRIKSLPVTAQEILELLEGK